LNFSFRFVKIMVVSPEDMTNNFVFYSVKIIKEIAQEIVYFPFWWYSHGLLRVIIEVKNFLVDRQRDLALFVWVKNVFKPMYGEYNWQGWIISFIMRVVQIIFRSIVLLIWLGLSAGILISWIILPALVFYQTLYQLTP
jgi:hypothetical protein